MRIEVTKLNESGYDQAMLGLALSYNQSVSHMPQVAQRLSTRDHGHNKFMEHIFVWLDVTAPRYWWQEADTYRISSKSSESTMHTLMKNKQITGDMFEETLPQDYLDGLNDMLATGDLLTLKPYLPEGFMQRRMWVLSYKELRHIFMQRHNHKLPHWREFIELVMQQVDHPELLVLDQTT